MDFLIVPSDQPEWAVSEAQMRQALLSRWPDAGLYGTSSESPMVLIAEVEYPQGTLQINLDRDGTMLSLDAPDVEAAADFAAWWARRAPGFDPDLRIYVTADYSRSAPLARDVTPEVLAAALTPR